MRTLHRVTVQTEGEMPRFVFGQQFEVPTQSALDEKEEEARAAGVAREILPQRQRLPRDHTDE